MRSLPVVLLITGSYPPAVCGVGDYTASLARAIACTGRWKVKVASSVSAAASAEDRRAGVEVFPLFDGWSLRELIPSVRRIQELQADLIHMQFPTQGYGRKFAPWLVPGLLRLRGKPVVQTWHEYIPGRRSLSTFVAAAAASEVVVVRPMYAERIPLLHRRAMRRARITHIPNASNIPVTRLSEAERRALHDSLVTVGRALVGYFGFAYPHKRVELLFDLLDSQNADLLIIGPLDRNDPYHRRIYERMSEPDWAGHASSTGFVSPERAADLLAACDVIVLPFADGGGEWNTSLHAVRSQGTFLVTTSISRTGYLADENTMYCAPNDMEGMRAAIAAVAPARVAPQQYGSTWEEVAHAHEVVYTRTLEDDR